MAQITLIILEDGEERDRFVFRGRSHCLVGRANDCDIQITSDPSHADVSRHHCAFEIDAPFLGVRDLDSLNGTYVNGLKIGGRNHRPVEAQPRSERTGEIELADGDEVRVGHSVFRVAVSRSGEIRPFDRRTMPASRS